PRSVIDRPHRRLHNMGHNMRAGTRLHDFSTEKCTAPPSLRGRKQGGFRGFRQTALLRCGDTRAPLRRTGADWPLPLESKRDSLPERELGIWLTAFSAVAGYRGPRAKGVWDHEDEDSARQRRGGIGRDEGIRDLSQGNAALHPPFARYRAGAARRGEALVARSRRGGEHSRAAARLRPARSGPRLHSRGLRTRFDGAADDPAHHDDGLRSRPGTAALLRLL